MRKLIFSTFFILNIVLFYSKVSYSLDSNVKTIPSYEKNKISINIDNNSSSKPTKNIMSRGVSSEYIDLYGEKDGVVEVFNHSNKSIYLTEDDVHLMAQVVYAESKGEPYEGKVAVASVILNRVVNPKFPNTISGVIMQKNAFSCVKNGVINVEPDTDSYKAVKDAIKGADPSNNALFFYNPKSSTCSWMGQIEKKNKKSIGQHVFFQI
ncbi:N-acetylmuramoyl-L-alanine amidase [Clostridium cavendishii DSM 21758]|uniref:N-acetylmuramoyl-L-alanine amidase n=1 Tax=Clostridium cavendishii DSM 21758 TaxID=1121302 RepID=A0A1M6LZ52_9CLOT|nr:cell wall hydrolase [Clostridium cavendishii]SHJ76343.1 N-acetylmuramoyl-L-alanine amidase [Clostridium cavendishii DSM 21758]